MLNEREACKSYCIFHHACQDLALKNGTGEKVLGVGDASGMFPIDSNTKDYDAAMLDRFDTLAKPYGFNNGHSVTVSQKFLLLAENAGTLTAEGARLLDYHAWRTGSRNSGMSAGR